MSSVLIVTSPWYIFRLAHDAIVVCTEIGKGSHPDVAGCAEQKGLQVESR